MGTGLYIGAVIMGIVIAAPIYIFMGMGFYRLGKVTGYKYPGFAWVPFVNTFLTAHIARQRKKPLGIAYIAAVGVSLVLTTLSLITSFSAFFTLSDATAYTPVNTQPFAAVLPTVTWLVGVAGGALAAILYGFIYKQFCAKQRASNFMAWTWLGVAWSVVSPWLPDFWIVTLATIVLAFLPYIFIFGLSGPPYREYKSRMKGPQPNGNM